jgi:hypothetical protein
MRVDARVRIRNKQGVRKGLPAGRNSPGTSATILRGKRLHKWIIASLFNLDIPMRCCRMAGIARL